MRYLGDGGNLLQARAQHLQAGRHVLVEEDHQVGLLRLDVSGLDPAAHEAVTVGRRTSGLKHTIRSYAEDSLAICENQ